MEVLEEGVPEPGEDISPDGVSQEARSADCVQSVQAVFVAELFVPGPSATVSNAVEAIRV